jgi:predicted membrane protein
MRSPSLTHPADRFHAAPRGDGPHRVIDLSRLLLGLVVLTLGVLFLLDAGGVLDAGRAIDHWWPLVVVAAGALTLLERPPSRPRGALLVGIGAVLLLFTTNLIQDSAWKYVWPAAVIIVGLAIVARWSGRTTTAEGSAADEVVRATAIFGGPNLVSAARQFRGAWLTAIFGGVTLDLRDACPAPEGASINATVAFGGIDILVPRGWRISVRSTPIFGGLDDKTDHSEPTPDDAPNLHIDAVVVFGGVDIKHDK